MKKSVGFVAKSFVVGLTLLCVATVSFAQEEYSEELVQKAQAGDPEAQYNLAICYSHGDGVEQNYDEAVKWYRLSAEQGHVVAQRVLGACYYLGECVEQNERKAMVWFLKATEQGDKEAIEIIEG